RLSAGQSFSVGAASGDQLVAHRAQRWGARVHRFTARGQSFAYGSEITNDDVHASHSANETKGTRSPWAMVRPAALSTSPSAQATEVSTPELWLENRSSPPALLRRTRMNSRRLSARVTSKWAGSITGTGMDWAAAAFTPCKASKNGRT